MELDGGLFAAKNKSQNSANKLQGPNKAYGWQLPIASAKRVV